VRRLAGPAGLDGAELYRLTGGNPFYVTAVLAAGMTEVPAAARDAVLARAVGLSSQARAVLDAAALTGARAGLRLVESVTSCAPPVVDEVLASGLVTVDGAWLRFRHEIARLAAEQAIPPHRRALIHARVLDALAAAGCDDDAQLAFHAEEAGNGSAVVRHASSAARRAAELASHREAAAQFERALRFAAGADLAVVAGLYGGLATELGLLDRWQDAADAVDRALGLWRQAGDRLREGAALRQLSITMWRLCRGAEAAAAAEAAVAVLDPLGPSAELAWAYAGLAVQRADDGRHDAAVELSRRAQALAGSLGVPEMLSFTLNTEAWAIASRGGDWTPPMRRALEFAISEHLPEQAGRTYANMHALYCGQLRFDEAERCFAEAIAYCDEHDLGTYGTCLRGARTARWRRRAAGRSRRRSASSCSPMAAPHRSTGSTRSPAWARSGRGRGRPAAGNASMRRLRPRTGAASRSILCSCGWPAPRPTGWRDRQPRPCARPSWPMTSAPGWTPGTAGRPLAGCGAPGPVGLRAVTSPSPTGCSWQGTGRKPPGCGPAWAAAMTPRWPCTMRRTRRHCVRR